MMLASVLLSVMPNGALVTGCAAKVAVPTVAPDTTIGMLDAPARCFDYLELGSETYTAHAEEVLVMGVETISPGGPTFMAL